MFKIEIPELIAADREAHAERRLLAQQSGATRAANVYVADRKRKVGCAIGVLFLAKDEAFASGLPGTERNFSGIITLVTRGDVAVADPSVGELALATQFLHDGWACGWGFDHFHLSRLAPEDRAVLDSVIRVGEKITEKVFLAWITHLERKFGIAESA